MFSLPEGLAPAYPSKMDPRAIEQAQAALARAQDAVSQMEDLLKVSTSMGNFNKAEAVWQQFLADVHGIYTVLELGSLTNRRSRDWYIQTQSVQENDPLLSYIQHARKPTGYVGLTSLDIGFEQNPEFNSESPPGTEIGILYPDVITLPTIVDEQSGREFPSPGFHLGQRLTNADPEGVAQSALTYFTSLVEEASTLTEQDDAALSSLDDIGRRLDSGVQTQFGNTREIEAREKLRASIAEFQNFLAQHVPQHGGIGHNNPPLDMALQIELTVNINPTINVINAEIAKPAPDVAAIAESTGKLRKAFLFVSGAVLLAVGGVANGFLSAAGEDIHSKLSAWKEIAPKIAQVIQAATDWLNIVPLP